MHRRYLALWLPHLPLDRLRRLDATLAGVPLATWQAVGSRRTLAAVATPALYPGQALADAQAICPTLRLIPADLGADADLLQRLALWALRWTPLAAVDGVDGLLLDVTGGTDLFGGEVALLAQVREGFVQAGFLAHAVLAGTAAAAAALERSGADGLIVPPGASLAAISPLPLASLRLPEAVVSSLSRLGLHCIADTLRQPRGPLARRYGRVLLDALDAVTGTRPQPLQPVREPAAFVAVQDLLEPISTRPAIDRVLHNLLGELCRQLLEAGHGARRLTLRAFRVDRMVQEVSIGTSRAVREVPHLLRLFAEPLGQLEPDLGFERLTLEAAVTEPLGGVQAALSGETSDAAVHHAALLAELIDRLSQRVTVSRLQPLSSHWPEYAVAQVAPLEPVQVPVDWGQEQRPVQLYATPRPILVTAGVPDGPPAQMRIGRELHRVLSSSGPERLEPEGWGADADRPARDYFRVQTEAGPRLWVCRLREPGQPSRWFLHGLLA